MRRALLVFAILCISATAHAQTERRQDNRAMLELRAAQARRAKEAQARIDAKAEANAPGIAAEKKARANAKYHRSAVVAKKVAARKAPKPLDMKDKRAIIAAVGTIR